MLRHYLSHFYQNYYKSKSTETEEQYLAREVPLLKQEVYRCLLLNNYFWGIWSLTILKKENIGNPNVFNFDFASARIAMYNHVKDLYAGLIKLE